MENKCSRCSYFDEIDAGWDKAMQHAPREGFVKLLNLGVSPIDILHGEIKRKIYEAENSDNYIFNNNPDFKEGFLEALGDIYGNCYELVFMEADRKKEAI
jgi:hypothetical protein